MLTLARLNQPRATIIQGKIGDIEPYLIIIVFGAEACEKMIHNLHEGAKLGERPRGMLA